MCGNGLIIKRKFFSFATSKCVNWASSSKYILSGLMNFIGERGMWMKSILWKFQLCKLIFIIEQKFIARRFRAFNSDRNVFIKSTHLSDRRHRLLVLSSNRNFTAFWYSCLIGQPSQIIIIKLTTSIAKIACNCCWLGFYCVIRCKSQTICSLKMANRKSFSNYPRRSSRAAVFGVSSFVLIFI